MGLFDKKYCDICGEKIGLLGNRKLEDGNLCKDCAKKLSPWFEERRHSSIDEIKKQLQYREENKTKVAQFQITQEIGEYWRVLIDENHRWFMVTKAKKLDEANPDVLDISQLTGCRMDVDETHMEIKREGPDGKKISYDPPKYEYSYNFNMKISVNSPYFDEMSFRLNAGSVALITEIPRGFIMNRSIDPSYNIEYRQYKQMGDDICEALTNLSRKPTEQASTVSSSAPAGTDGHWTCPDCGAQNSGKFCEFCGTARPR